MLALPVSRTPIPLAEARPPPPVWRNRAAQVPPPYTGAGTGIGGVVLILFALVIALEATGVIGK
jgi:hypothetical protein